MAESTLSTSVSDHSMSPHAAPGVPAFAVPDRDGVLLRRVAEAERYLADFVRQDAVCGWLHDAVGRHPEVPDPMIDSPQARERWDWAARRLGLPDADTRRARLYTGYEDAAEAAFGMPAHTFEGLHAKMRLAVAVLKERHPEGWEHIDCQCLDGVLADLDRLAAGNVA